MGRWLLKGEREKRDKKVVELYHLGLPYKAISESMRLGSVGAVAVILKSCGVKTDRMSKSESRIEDGAVPKAGDKRLVEGLPYVWVVCPLCGFGRWVQKCNAERLGFTGRCKSCYMKVARREIGINYA